MQVITNYNIQYQEDSVKVAINKTTFLGFSANWLLLLMLRANIVFWSFKTF